MASVNYTVRFPLTFDQTGEPGHDGLGSEDLKSLVFFNMKNVLLTNPGERMFDSAFGVGLNQFIFENLDDPSVPERIRTTILSQMEQYVAYVSINDIQMTRSPQNSMLMIGIHFVIDQLGISDILSITIDQTSDGVAINLGDNVTADAYRALKGYTPQGKRRRYEPLS